METRAQKKFENQEMSIAKFTIVIFILAALLFAVAPNLSWGSSTRRPNFAWDLPRQ